MPLTKVTTQMMSEVGAKAWVNYDNDGTATINDSFNVASVTDTGVGIGTVNFTEDMANTDYVVMGSAIGSVSTTYALFYCGDGGAVLVGSFDFQARTYSGALTDSDVNAFLVFGDQ